MKTFSQRKGLTPISDIIQKDFMTIELRNLLWNEIGRTLFMLPPTYKYYNSSFIEYFGLIFHTKYLKQPFDTLSNGVNKIVEYTPCAT